MVLRFYSYATNRVKHLCVGLCLLGSITHAEQAVDDIRPEKTMVHIPTPANYWLWALVIGLLAVAGWLGWRWWKKHNTPAAISAYRVAIDKLNKVEPLINEESAEPLVNQTSEIIREFIEKRFGISALSQSTEEFLQHTHRNSNAEMELHKDRLGDFLKSCDKVKFGRAEMDNEDRKSLVSNARKFLQDCTPDQQIEEGGQHD